MAPTGQGQFSYLLTVDTPGLWQVQASCTGPFAESKSSAFDVAQQIGSLAVGGPWLMTADLDPLVTEQGAILTVQRVTALPAAATLDGTESVVGVQAGAAKKVTVAALAAAAAAQPTQASLLAAMGSGAAVCTTTGQGTSTVVDSYVYGASSWTVTWTNVGTGTWTETWSAPFSAVYQIAFGSGVPVRTRIS